MKVYPTEKIRNIALVGHGGSGKTTLAEALLFAAGASTRLGRVDDGNTVSDYDPDEIKRKVSISTSLVSCEWQDHKINILDTPGYADFIGEVIAALRVANAMIIVVDAVSGVQVQTEKAWRLAEESNLPRLFFINRLDKEHADFAKTVAELQEAFGKTVAPLELPIGAEGAFKGIADIVDNNAHLYEGGKATITDFPADLAVIAAPYREQLMEAVAESDDALLEKYLDGKELTHDEIAKGVKRALLTRSLAPVLCGSAYALLGIEELLATIVQEVPSPAFVGAVAGHELRGDGEVKREPSTKEPLSAFVFKTVADPYVGKLSYFRVYSGSLKADSQVFNAVKGRKERIGHLYFMQGKHQKDTAEIPAGDIGAAPKLADIGSGDTICDEAKPLTFEPIAFPEPLVSVAVGLKTKGDDEKLGASLIKLAEEDPTVRFKRDAVTHEQVLSGVGDLHIEVVLDKLTRRYGVEAVTSTPKLAYKETIKGSAKDIQGKYKKQTGGRGQYGDAVIDLEPLARGGNFEFVDKVVGGAIPRNFIPAVEKGIREALEGGILTSYPTVDVRVTLKDGSFHPVDSSEMAFKIAGSMAIKKAMSEAKPILLEPIYNLEITVPDNHMGDVMGDLSGKRGKILGMEPLGKEQIIKAQVPLAEIQRYSTELRSLTSGRGSYSMQFSHYEEMPADQTHKIIEAAKKEEDPGH
ncbi:MAG: elongation factor G [Actinomycetota bacterium]|nr:elongation factor G [Actinomycetota bacterium]